MLHDGLKIKWLSFEGYVHRDHLPNPCEPLDKQSRLDNVSAEATVLYSLPMIRCVHFTMQSPPALSLECFDPCLADDGIPSDSQVQLGQTVNSAEVLAASRRGITLKLHKSGVTGYVPASQVADFGEVPEDMRATYPAGVRLTCRVMTYDPMDRTFICTMQK